MVIKFKDVASFYFQDFVCASGISVERDNPLLVGSMPIEKSCLVQRQVSHWNWRGDTFLNSFSC